MSADQVFGYGSLLDDDDGAGRLARLNGWRRRWGVAMDNTVDLPGYKAYLRPDGTRPALFVAFLDLAPDPGATVDGVLLATDPARLAELDRRERNYARVDVTAALPEPPPPGGTVWAYVGTHTARERLAHALREHRAVIQRDYLDAVEAGFAARGALDAFRTSTEPPPCPVEALRRIELP